MLVYLGATAGYRAGGFNLGNPDDRAEFDTGGEGKRHGGHSCSTALRT